jgi:drug/metabolite transporter (DMT)-like permease
MAALLYLGAGIGMSIVGVFRHKSSTKVKGKKMTKRELPFIIAMIILDIVAPILLMIGLTKTSPESVSLLNNFEIVATSLIAFFLFKEVISKRLWIGIGLVTIASIILSVNDISSLSFSISSFYVLLAAICWGFENNCTRMLSVKDPLQVVIIKGFGSGIGSLIICFILKETSSSFMYIIIALLLGFVSYGLSIFFYVKAQRDLGAAKTSAYYAVSPFIGVGLSLMIFQEKLTIYFIIALIIMVVGSYFTSIDNK